MSPINSKSSLERESETSVVDDEKLSDSSTDSEEPFLDAETDRRLLRKTDLYLCPMMMLVYAIQFMDKSTNSTASVMGLREEMGMTGDMYGWSGSAFYLGYLIFEFPAVYLLQRFPLIKTLSAFIVVWGVVLCLHATPNYAGFITLRVLLGMLESAVTPAFVILTAQWYKREEQFLRTSIWLGSNGIGIIVGTMTAYGLATNDNLPIPGWKLVFIITGIITILAGVAIYFHIPDDPSKAWFLTETERKQVLIRIRSNQQGFENKQFKKDQFIEAFQDPRTWIYFFYMVSSSIPNGGLTNFMSILFSETMGLGKLQGLLLQAPQGATELVGCIMFGILVQITQKQVIMSIIAQCIAIMAMCLLAFVPGNQSAGLAGLYLIIIYPVGFICMLSGIAANTAGHTKKVTVNAILLIGYCVGNILGPQTFRAKHAPAYVPAKVTMVVLMSFATVLNGLLMWVNMRENKKRDKEGSIATPEQIRKIQLEDLTDKQNRFFRYIN